MCFYIKMEVSEESMQTTTVVGRGPQPVNESNANMGVVNMVDGFGRYGVPTINMNNSSDVVIGPLTQYHGPVTIYQYLNSEDSSDKSGLEKSNHQLDQVLRNNLAAVTDARRSKTSTLSNNPSPTESQQLTPYGGNNFCTLTKTTIILIVTVTALVFCMVAVVVYFQVIEPLQDRKGKSVYAYEFPDIISDGRETNQSIGGGHKLIYRDVWGGVEPRATRALVHPTPYVVISHMGGLTPRCEDEKTCEIQMRNMQSDHYIRFGSPDVGQNFMIGGDSNVYVGRGWDATNHHANYNIVIVFSGDYSKIDPTPAQLDAAKRLIDLGVNLGKLSTDYKLIGHNQTTFTLSPGPNLYKEIVKWPHWYNCSSKGNVTCGAEVNWPPVWTTAY